MFQKLYIDPDRSFDIFYCRFDNLFQMDFHSFWRLTALLQTLLCECCTYDRMCNFSIKVRETI